MMHVIRVYFQEPAHFVPVLFILAILALIISDVATRNGKDKQDYAVLCSNRHKRDSRHVHKLQEKDVS